MKEALACALVIVDHGRIQYVPLLCPTGYPYCQIELNNLPADELESLKSKAAKLGDYTLAGHLMRDVDSVWAE